jgi:Ca2+-binding RTX toxin-like protein
MLWLAGIMGLVAVGAVTFVELDKDDDEDVPPVEGPKLDHEQEDAVAAAQQAITDANGGTQTFPGDTDTLNPPSPYDLATDGDDILAGDEDDDDFDAMDGDDQVGGRGGADQLRGGAGDDVMHGGDGADTVEGGTGDDTLHGDDGNDSLNGNAGDDTLYGHNGDDTLNGGAGDDSVQGSAGNDLVAGGDGDDAVHGGLGNDSLSGDAGADTLFGGWGDDVLNGLALDPATQGIADTDDADFLNGGGGNDQIIAGNGDIVTAGDGEDTIIAGDWINEGSSASITNFDVTEDNLVLIWDDAEGDEPVVELAVDEQDAATLNVMMNGVTVATVDSEIGFDISDVALLPLSLVASSGLAGLSA